MGLRVIGAGFGRTGTNSLKLALEQLGFYPCHHMFELWEHPEQLPGWQAAARGESPDWNEVFTGYAAQVDWPGTRFWRELADYFPNAKVILSTRAEDSWFESVQSTIIRLARLRALAGSQHIRAVADLAYEIIVQQTFDGQLNDREHALAVFRRHNRDVQRRIARDRLLTYQISEGWAPLCQFLDVPVPDTPFPHSNRRQNFSGRAAVTGRSSVARIS
jgi:uncharacterized protein YndB with AHSA1/START domain